MQRREGRIAGSKKEGRANLVCATLGSTTTDKARSRGGYAVVLIPSQRVAAVGAVSSSRVAAGHITTVVVVACGAWVPRGVIIVGGRIRCVRITTASSNGNETGKEQCCSIHGRAVLQRDPRRQKEKARPDGTFGRATYSIRLPLEVMGSRPPPGTAAIREIHHHGDPHPHVPADTRLRRPQWHCPPVRLQSLATRCRLECLPSLRR